MTYRELAHWILDLDKEGYNGLDCDATVFLSKTDEYMPVTGVDFTVENDVLNDNHPIIEVNY